MKIVRSHAAFILLFLLLVPAVFHFTAADVVSSMGDDSIAYLALARYMVDPGDALVRDWVGYQGHFPPLFPAVLALTTGASNFQVAHAVVAVFALLSIVLLYRYAAAVFAENAAALLVVALFLLTPTAWISVRGILSESMFLFATLACLYYHRTRLESADAARLSHLLVFGFLLGAALLVRSAAATLIVGYGVHAVVAAARERNARGLARRLIALAPVALMAALWLAWRPRAEGYNYGNVLATILLGLGTEPMAFLRNCVDHLFGGWIRTFTADSNVHWLSKWVFGAVGLLGIAGAVLRAWKNHLDGWYVLATLPLLLVWLFPEDNTRRLLYPLVPLLILQAAVFVRFAARRVERRRLLFAAAVALPALLCIPAWLLVQSKSLDRERVTPEFRYRYSDITEYYTTVGVQASRAIAARHAKVLSGLESLKVVTPPGARVMWVRPDYVGILGDRPGVAWYYRWSAEDFLREIERAKVDYLVISTLLKSDMEGAAVHEGLRFEWALGISEVVFSEVNVTRDGYDVAVLKINRAALASRSGGR